jgi:tRNA dimethylallyltransferase
VALPKIIVIVGPTASGKTALSLDLAREYNGEIVNADSRQVYRGMNIGTAKAPKDAGSDKYLVQGVSHYLIDVVNPDEEFSLAHYKRLAEEAIDDILARGKLPIVVGGTGLYIWAMVDNLDIPAVAPNLELRAELKKIDIKNTRRVLRALEVALSGGPFIGSQKKNAPKYEALQIGLSIGREELVNRINARVDEQIKEGLVDEVSALAKKYAWTLPAMSGIGYRQIGYYLRGEMPLDEAIEEIKKATRRYAKRQMTWFRRDKRIKWIKDMGEVEEMAGDFLKISNV